jgi:hypothetical protein
LSSRCVPEYIQRADFFQSNTLNFIVKDTFKATCFGSTEPSSGLFVRTDHYPTTSTFGIPNVEFYSKNKFEKSVHLVGFIIRNLARCTVT